MSQTSRDRVNSRRVRTHKKNSGDAVRRLGTIIQSIFCAQSGTSIRLTVWKWSGESRYPGAFPLVLKNFCRAFSPGPTDRPWVSEDGTEAESSETSHSVIEYPGSVQARLMKISQKGKNHLQLYVSSTCSVPYRSFK